MDLVALDQKRIDTIWQALTGQAARTDLRDRQSPPPASVNRIYWTIAATFSATIAAVLASTNAFTLTQSWWTFSAVTVALLAIGIAARTRPAMRLPALGLLTGTIFATACVAVIVLV